MDKLTKQNVNGIDYSMVGCALTGACASAASDYVKIVTLSDGDVVSDGMSVVITFAEGNTAGNAPASQTIYSSDQVNYYADAGLTQPFTLAPSGCYTIEYTGEGNAYTYQSYPVLQIGTITAPVCDARGHKAADKAWKAGEKVTVQYTGGLFLITSMGDNAVNSVTQGEMRPVTSNAVAQFVPPLATRATSADSAANAANANYAFEAGSAIRTGYADEADWAINQGFSHQFIDCSSLDQNTWYPCVLNLSASTPTQIYCCTELDAKSHPSWATHASGFTALLHIEAIGGGWGATSAQGIVFRNDQSFFTGDAPVGFAFASPSSSFIFYLRGGGIYDLANNKGQTFRLHPSGYPDVGGEVFGPLATPPYIIAKATITADLNGRAVEAGNADNADNANTLDNLDSLYFMHSRTGDNGTTAQLQAAIVNNGSAGPCCGSYQITDGPFGDIWYNFIYIPHRTGIGQDNYLWGTLVVFTMTDNTNKMAIKHLMNGDWQGWAEINAGTVGGYAADMRAIANTAAVRDASGYFNAVIFHDEWVEENINSYNSPKIMFKGNGDGFLRNTDPSLVRVGSAGVLTTFHLDYLTSRRIDFPTSARIIEVAIKMVPDDTSTNIKISTAYGVFGRYSFEAQVTLLAGTGLNDAVLGTVEVLVDDSLGTYLSIFDNAMSGTYTVSYRVII